MTICNKVETGTLVHIKAYNLILLALTHEHQGVQALDIFNPRDVQYLVDNHRMWYLRTLAT